MNSKIGGYLNCFRTRRLYHCDTCDTSLRREDCLRRYWCKWDTAADVYLYKLIDISYNHLNERIPPCTWKELRKKTRPHFRWGARRISLRWCLENPIFDGEREEYRYVDYSLWLYIQQPDTTTSGWQRRRETGDQVRLPLPWCLERNTHNHERRRKTGDRGPGTSTPALMFRP